MNNDGMTRRLEASHPSWFAPSRTHPPLPPTMLPTCHQSRGSEASRSFLGEISWSPISRRNFYDAPPAVSAPILLSAWKLTGMIVVRGHTAVRPCSCNGIDTSAVFRVAELHASSVSSPTHQSYSALIQEEEEFCPLLHPFRSSTWRS
jgi:hypothetical protein